MGELRDRLERRKTEYKFGREGVATDLWGERERLDRVAGNAQLPISAPRFWPEPGAPPSPVETGECDATVSRPGLGEPPSSKPGGNRGIRGLRPRRFRAVSRPGLVNGW